MQDARDPRLPLGAAIARLGRAETEPDLLAAVQRLQRALEQLGPSPAPEVKALVMQAGESVKQTLRRLRGAPEGTAGSAHPMALAAYRTAAARRR